MGVGSPFFEAPADIPDDAEFEKSEPLIHNLNGSSVEYSYVCSSECENKVL